MVEPILSFALYNVGTAYTKFLKLKNQITSSKLIFMGYEWRVLKIKINVLRKFDVRSCQIIQVKQ